MPRHAHSFPSNPVVHYRYSSESRPRSFSSESLPMKPRLSNDPKFGVQIKLQNLYTVRAIDARCAGLEEVFDLRAQRGV